MACEKATAGRGRERYAGSMVLRLRMSVPRKYRRPDIRDAPHWNWGRDSEWRHVGYSLNADTNMAKVSAGKVKMHWTASILKRNSDIVLFIEAIKPLVIIHSILLVLHPRQFWCLVSCSLARSEAQRDSSKIHVISTVTRF
jgi:hypothetical protein